MKDFRSSLLVLVSILLLISMGLLVAVFYHIYYKPAAYKPIIELTSKDQIIISSVTRDSLQQVYNAAIHDLDTKLDSAWTNADSLNNRIDTKLTEFYKLRQEIATLLKDGTPNADLNIARRKIRELRERVAALHFINNDVSTENDRLASLVKQLKKPVTEPVSEPVNEPVIERRSPVEKAETVNIGLQVSDLKIAALQVKDDSEKETTVAADAAKLSGSMLVKSKATKTGAELFVVIIQPNGKVLQGSNWDAGSFATSKGKKLFTRKITTDLKSGEPKKLSFSVGVDDLLQGNYQMQVYQNGQLVGNTIQRLQ